MSDREPYRTLNRGSNRSASADVLARTISIVLHPFIIYAALAALGTWRLAPQHALKLLAVALGIILVVWIFVVHRHRSGRWTTVDASHPRERPALFALVLVLLTAYTIWVSRISVAMTEGAIAIGVMVGLAAFANRWIKLSLHMASLAFFGIAAWPLSVPASSFAIACLPLLAWSRLRMGRHVLAEVVGGTVLGGICALALHTLAN